MKKLTKTELWEMVQEIAKTTVQDHADLFKKGNADKFSIALVDALAEQLKPKTGGGTSTKVNESGDVYCNYFEDYLPASAFNTKLSKPDRTTGERREVYKANCKDAEQILRRIKAVKANVTKQATEAFRSKLIDEAEFDRVFNILDEIAETKYSSVDDVLTPKDIVVLANEMNKAAKSKNVAYDEDIEEDYDALADEIESIE